MISTWNPQKQEKGSSKKGPNGGGQPASILGERFKYSREKNDREGKRRLKRSAEESERVTNHQFGNLRACTVCQLGRGFGLKGNWKITPALKPTGPNPCCSKASR